MAYQHAIAGHQGGYADPTIRKIGVSDVFDILAEGVADSNEKPSHFFFLALIYPLVILFLAGLAFGHHLFLLLFPLAAGFVLLGPVAAIGLYELGRRREQSQEIAWRHAFGAPNRRRSASWAMPSVFCSRSRYGPSASCRSRGRLTATLMPEGPCRPRSGRMPGHAMWHLNGKVVSW